MRRVSSSRLFLAAVIAAIGVFPPIAFAATGEVESRQLAEAAADTARTLGDSADLMLRYIQEDGPESGHIRVVATPEARPLTIIEARMAAEQAFLATLNEPGLGDELRRITVVVRLMPASHPDPDATEQVVVYQYKGGQDWSVLLGE